MLARFTRADRLFAIRDAGGNRIESVVEMLLALDEVPSDVAREQAFFRHLGDYTLFMSGIFREYTEHFRVSGFLHGRRAQRRTEGFGTSKRDCSGHPRGCTKGFGGPLNFIPERSTTCVRPSSVTSDRTILSTTYFDRSGIRAKNRRTDWNSSWNPSPNVIAFQRLLEI